MLTKLTIRARLIASMVFLGVLIVVIGVVGVYGMRSANSSLQDVYTNQMASALKLTDTKNLLNRARFNIDRGIFHADAPDVQNTLTRAEEFLQQSDVAWKEYLALPSEADEKALSDDLATKRAAYIDGALQALLKALRDKDAEKVDVLAMTKVTPLFRTYDGASVKLEQYQLTTARQTFEASQVFYDRLLKGFTAAILIGLAFIIIATIFLLRAIMRPLDQALHHFDEIAAGNLSERIDLSRKDEMGALAGGPVEYAAGLVEHGEQRTHRQCCHRPCQC